MKIAEAKTASEKLPTTVRLPQEPPPQHFIFKKVLNSKPINVKTADYGI